MRFLILLCMCLLALFAGQSMADECPSICTADYSPVCGELAGRKQTFGNSCALEVKKCVSKEDWQLKNVGEC